MCDTCGCGDPNRVSVDVHEKILSVNDRNAAHNREHLARHGVFAIGNEAHAHAVVGRGGGELEGVRFRRPAVEPARDPVAV